MNILVTGITGFFGKSILKVIRDHSDIYPYKEINIFSFSRDPDYFFTKNPDFKNINWLHIKKQDINKDKIDLNIEIDCIVHMAQDSSEGPSLEPISRLITSFNITKNILDFASQKKIKKFILISSGSVYGNLINSDQSRENMPNYFINNQIGSSYNLSKINAEFLALEYANKFDFTLKVARCFSFVGEYLPVNSHYAISSLIYDAVFNDQIIIKGNGKAVRSYMYQDDLAIALIKLILDDSPGYEIFNIGSDQPISILDLAKLIKKTLSSKKDIVVLDKLNNMKSNFYVPNIKKFNDKFKFKPNVNLTQGISIVHKYLINR